MWVRGWAGVCLLGCGALPLSRHILLPFHGLLVSQLRAATLGLLSCVRTAEPESLPGLRCPSADNSCLNKVLETRRGIPISLGLIYLEVAARLGGSGGCGGGLPLLGVNIPGHFFLSPADPELEFLIDPFTGGLPGLVPWAALAAAAGRAC
jgi:hypothetical protein